MVDIRAPKERTCTECGRREVFDEDAKVWRVAGDDVGNVYCVHSWDITGTFTPVRTEE